MTPRRSAHSDPDRATDSQPFANSNPRGVRVGTIANDRGPALVWRPLLA